MKRFALLIGGKDLPASSQAQGVEKDLVDFANHLVSDRGGAWESSEMEIILHPTRGTVLEWLQKVEKSAEYCTILYAGHGCHYKSPLNETALCLAEKEEILVRELNPRTPRHFVILDTCRKLTAVEGKFVKAAASELSLSERKRAPSYRDSCRKLFDQAMSESEEGRSVAYACDVNQTAGDNEQGGYFTQAMLNHATAFHGNNAFRIAATATHPVRDNFRLAFETVQNVNYPQKPVLEEGRRITPFPFAIK